MSILLRSPSRVATDLAARVRARRLDREWTQAELAERAGVALPTLKVFERTGQISLARLLRIAAALDCLHAADALFAPPPARTLDELETQAAPPARKYGRRRQPTAPPLAPPRPRGDDDAAT